MAVMGSLVDPSAYVRIYPRIDMQVLPAVEEEAPLGQRVLKRLRNSQDPMNRDLSWEELSQGKPLCAIGQSGTRGQCIPRGRIEDLLLTPRRTPDGKGWQL